MTKLDPHTFGDSPAAVTLAEILSQDGYEKIRTKAAAKYNFFCETMWKIFEIKDMPIRAHLFSLVMKDSREKVNAMNVPDEVKSFLLNVMHKTYRNNVKHCRDIIVGEKAKEQRLRRKKLNEQRQL